MAGNVVYVQGSYVDVHDNEVVNLSIDKAGSVSIGEGQQGASAAVPAVLAESELWQRLKDARLVDEHGQPLVSRPEAALMAYMLAERLHIDQKWKFFEQLWHRKNMRNDYNTALEQHKSLDFQDRLKEILD